MKTLSMTIFTTLGLSMAASAFGASAWSSSSASASGDSASASSSSSAMSSGDWASAAADSSAWASGSGWASADSSAEASTWSPGSWSGGHDNNDWTGGGWTWGNWDTDEVEYDYDHHYQSAWVVVRPDYHHGNKYEGKIYVSCAYDPYYAGCTQPTPAGVYVQPAPQAPTAQVPNPVNIQVVIIDGKAYPICSSREMDPDGDSWGWEFEQSCKVL